MFVHVLSGERLPGALRHRALRQPGEPARVAFGIVGLNQGSLHAGGDAGHGGDCLGTSRGPMLGHVCFQHVDLIVELGQETFVPGADKLVLVDPLQHLPKGLAELVEQKQHGHGVLVHHPLDEVDELRRIMHQGCKRVCRCSRAVV
eukprot:350404-Chlamydomonas_euryale.AAC.2